MIYFKKRMEILFWRHSTKSQKKKGICTLYLRITVNGLREEIGSTTIKINFANWHEGMQRILDREEHASFKNEQIGLIQMRLLAIYNDLVRKGNGVSAERIRRLYTQPAAITYMTAFDMFQLAYNKDVSIAKSTKDKFKTVKTSILTFLIEQRMPGILLEEFDAMVVNEYKTWCKNQGFSDSYVLRNVRDIKRITAYGKSKRFIDYDPLEGYKVGREKIAKPKFLDSVQLSIWRSHKFLHETCQRVADLFVLYARTGFHYRDLMQVLKDPERYIQNGIDGKQWILKPRQKTDVDAKIPIHQFPEIQEIVNKYGGWEHVPRYSNDAMNDYLKLCAADINIRIEPIFRIYSKLSVKHGRSSFCDYCLNELVLPENAILTMMGRESAAELKRYARNDERSIVNGFRISNAALAS